MSGTKTERTIAIPTVIAILLRLFCMICGNVVGFDLLDCTLSDCSFDFAIIAIYNVKGYKYFLKNSAYSKNLENPMLKPIAETLYHGAIYQ